MSNEQQPNVESQDSEVTKPADSGKAEPVVESAGQETESVRKETTLSAGEQEKLKRVYRMKEKIALGEAELSDAPEWIQRIIKEENAEAEKLDKAVQKGIAQREEETRYKNLMDSLEDISLGDDQKDAIEEQYAKLSKAMPKDEALELSLKIVGVELPDELDQRHSATVFPRGGRYKINEDKKDLGTQTDDEVVSEVLAYNNKN